MSHIGIQKLVRNLRRMERVQYLVGEARGLLHNDRDQSAHERCDKALAEAFDIIVSLRGEHAAPSPPVKAG